MFVAVYACRWFGGCVGCLLIVLAVSFFVVLPRLVWIVTMVPSLAYFVVECVLFDCCVCSISVYVGMFGVCVISWFVSFVVVVWVFAAVIALVLLPVVFVCWICCDCLFLACGWVFADMVEWCCLGRVDYG